MRRVLLALLSAMALASAAVTLPALPASSETIEGFDAGVAVVDLVGEIAPAGSYGMYEVTATLNGATPGNVMITNTVTGGVIDPNHSDLAACSGQSDGSMCSVELAPEVGSPDAATIRVAVLSSETAPAVNFTAEVTLDGDDTVVGIDANPSNDRASAITPVEATGGSSAFVPEGESLTFEANAQVHVLTVTAALGDGGGAIVSMSDPGLMLCGSNPCHGVHIEFEQGGQNEAFQAETEIDSTGPHDPCRGLGNACTAIYWRKSAEFEMAVVVPCGTEGQDEPCLQRKYKSSPGGKIHYVTEMDTTDPDLGLPGLPG